MRPSRPFLQLQAPCHRTWRLTSGAPFRTRRPRGELGAEISPSPLKLGVGRDVEQGVKHAVTRTRGLHLGSRLPGSLGVPPSHTQQVLADASSPGISERFPQSQEDACSRVSGVCLRGQAGSRRLYELLPFATKNEAPTRPGSGPELLQSLSREVRFWWRCPAPPHPIHFLVGRNPGLPPANPSPPRRGEVQDPRSGRPGGCGLNLSSWVLADNVGPRGMAVGTQGSSGDPQHGFSSPPATSRGPCGGLVTPWGP